MEETYFLDHLLALIYTVNHGLTLMDTDGYRYQEERQLSVDSSQLSVEHKNT